MGVQALSTIALTDYTIYLILLCCFFKRKQQEMDFSVSFWLKLGQAVLGCTLNIAFWVFSIFSLVGIIVPWPAPIPGAGELLSLPPLSLVGWTLPSILFLQRGRVPSSISCGQGTYSAAVFHRLESHLSSPLVPWSTMEKQDWIRKKDHPWLRSWQLMTLHLCVISSREL